MVGSTRKVEAPIKYLNYSVWKLDSLDRQFIFLTLLIA